MKKEEILELNDFEQSNCEDAGFIVVDFPVGKEETAIHTPTTTTCGNEGLQLRLQIDDNTTCTESVIRADLEVSSYNCHACEHCGKAFPTKYRLRRHNLVHSGERPFDCDVCGRGFIERGHLQVHRRLHTGEKPFKCAYCDRSFAHKPHVTEHERIHSGERPYQCGQCGKTFKRQTHRRGHERNVHKIVS